MSNPPSNLPFAPSISDEELDAELERFRPEAPSAPAAGAPSAPAPRESTPSPSAAPVPEIRAMPPTNASAQARPREPEDMFSNLDQSPKKPATPTGLGDLPARAPSSALKYALIFLAVVVVIGLLGFGFWYFAVKRPADKRAQSQANSAQVVIPAPLPPNPVAPSAPVSETPSAPQPVDPTLPSNGVSDLPPENTVPAPLPTPVVTPPPGANVPPPEPVSPQPAEPAPTPASDADNDGLSDQRELEIGTDPRNPDTDADELKDGDEVLKYGTNPVDRDTDKDSFVDGKEVQNGYNPRGGGKCAKQDCSL